jgi:hypothetical protein
VARLRARDLVWLPLLFCGLAFGQNGALRITEPAPRKDGTIVTSEPALALKGTLSWTGGDMRVLWKNYRGFSDLATVTVAEDRRTVLWSTTSPIPLRPGVNHVRIQALGQPGAAAFVNVFYAAKVPAPGPPVGTTMLKGQQIAYEAIGGRAVYQSDMILGPLADVAAGRFAGRFAKGGLRPQSATVAPDLQSSSTGLWPVVNGVVRVPYTIANTSGDLTNINAAIAESNTQLAGVVQWVSAAGDANFVNFDFDTNDQSGSCEAIVGMQGGSQPIGGAGNCTTGTILHEMGHALGLYHEQSRADRNTWVNYQEANVDKPQHANFDILASEVDSGLFNYASIMEYGPFTFSLYGVAPVMETIPAGMVLSTDLPQYTTGDLDGIMRLYGFTPSAVTVDTNPTGLQVVVDGTTCTAPCVFNNWALGSQHTLSVPLDSHSQTLQTLSQQPYIFGRWNVDVSNTQSTTFTITNSPGDGTLLSPTTSPEITNYLASFIPVHPYSPKVSPPNAGTISALPPASTLIINGTSTSYYLDRQLVTLSVVPSGEYSFYAWEHVPLYNFYTQSYSFYIISNFDYDNFDTSYPVTAYLVNDPVLTIGATAADIAANGISPGFAIGVVDGSQNTVTTYTPQNFDLTNNGAGFAGGSNLTLCASGWDGSTCPLTPVAQSPVTTNVTYLFTSWTGDASGATNAISLTMPTNTSQEIDANYIGSFRAIILPSLYCSGISITSSPASTNSSTDGGLDAFFNAGTINFTANADASGVVGFVGWSQDLSGTANPNMFPLVGELIGTANYNIPGTAPLTVTSISPAAPTVTSSTTTITVAGTGFTTNSNVTYAYFGTGDGNFSNQGRTVTLQSPTQMQFRLQAGDLASAGYYQILILNATSTGCDPQTTFTFPVANSAGAPALTVSKSHLGDFGPGQQNATYTILVTNSGTGTVTAPVTVTENVPSGETLVSMAGSGWNCSVPPACTNSNLLAPTKSYGAITVTVNVAASPETPQVNSATVSGGGALPATATDSTNIVTTVMIPNVTDDTESQAETAILNAGLVVGTITTQSSTVPAGEAIRTNPSGGMAVAPGSTVSIVMSTGPPATGPCDVMRDGAYTVADVQAMINEALGTSQPVNDLNGDQVVNVVDIQIVINAVLTSVCTV